MRILLDECVPRSLRRELPVHDVDRGIMIADTRKRKISWRCLRQCKKCDSTNVVKNGRTSAGQKTYCCRDCGVSTVTDDRAQERAAKMDLVEKLYREQVSQRGIAHMTGVSRPTIIRHVTTALMSV